MNDLETYESALSAKLAIEAIHARASDELRAISGGGPMGLTPDSVKQSSEFRSAKSKFDHCHVRLKQFNAAFIKQYGRQYVADLRARWAESIQ
jgi:hypothetical protein